MSQTSSHFCDLDLEDHHDDDRKVEVVVEGSKEDLEKQKPVPISSNSKPEQPLPPKAAHRLFTVCLALNVIGLVLGATGHFPYARHKAALFAIGNILALILCRTEAFLRVVFWLAVKLLGRSWVPIPFRTATTSFLQCLGGIHSSCSVSSVAWLVYALVLTLKDRENTSPEIIGVASTILALLRLSCLAAFPLVCHLHHNVFERIHRFVGWTALGLNWAFVILTFSYQPESKIYNVRSSRLV
ncbi:PREDICTED: uncharacterized protein LOC104613140 [Nelumbo nucifera]|uniref:Uncharacterized protein LOC104613140 n=1 Tax=Nelumbo nucifera TaxID=4432 RepID=A0A1U8BG83_NELNU|nr:PREDICTED: uncharacterized protein LOC104613140 [Nelumbo nucifera]